MKMKELFIAIAIIAICIFSFIGCNDVKYNNFANMHNLITEKYSNSQIENLKNSVKSDTISFVEFKKEFNPQCTRKTHQGYYVILSQEDEKNAFVFINQGFQLVDVMIVDKFKTKKEFQLQVVGQTTKSEVLLFDSNAVLLPISSVEVTVHLVQEGIFIVKYSRFLDGRIIEDPIVSSLEFIKNEEIPTSEDVFIRDSIPFVLGIDKIDD